MRMGCVWRKGDGCVLSIGASSKAGPPKPAGSRHLRGLVLEALRLRGCRRVVRLASVSHAQHFLLESDSLTLNVDTLTLRSLSNLATHPSHSERVVITYARMRYHDFV